MKHSAFENTEEVARVKSRCGGAVMGLFAAILLPASLNADGQAEPLAYIRGGFNFTPANSLLELCAPPTSRGAQTDSDEAAEPELEAAPRCT